jgi:hypothetical protein
MRRQAPTCAVLLLLSVVSASAERLQNPAPVTLEMARDATDESYVRLTVLELTRFRGHRGTMIVPGGVHVQTNVPSKVPRAAC